jgi:ubiquinone/menaquinone biosynthesis C-methylase UbiE
VLRALCVGGCLLSGFSLQPSYAQRSAAHADINRHFVNPVFAEWVARFERPGREIYDQRHRIVEATAVRPAMVVADIGAGTGLFTRLFSQRVGDSGKVYAVDISPVFIDNILRISRLRERSNVVGIVNDADDVALPPQSIDLAFICDTYHHFEYPQAMMASIRRALKPGGSVVVIDFRKIPGISTPWVMGHVRANQSTVVREIESFGYRLVEDRDFLRTNYFLRFVPA